MGLSWFGKMVDKAWVESGHESVQKSNNRRKKRKGISKKQLMLNMETHKRLTKGVNQLSEMQLSEDERWNNLQKRGITRVPAMFKHKPQTLEIASVMAELASINPNSYGAMDKYNRIEVEMNRIYNDLKAFLNEPTSVGQKAEWWQAKYFDALKGSPWQTKEKSDRRASEVWDALRRYMETADGKINVSNFGSEQAFSMLYNYNGADSLLNHLRWVMDEDSHDQGDVPADFFTTIRTW